RAIMTSQRSGKIVLVGEAVEPAARHHRRAKRMGYPFQLRHHACGLADHDLAFSLSGAAVELEALRHRTNGAHKMLVAIPAVGLGDDTAVIADRTHRNDAGTASAIEMLAQPVVGLLGLLVAMRPNEAIEDLSQCERQIFGIFGEDRAH